MRSEGPAEADYVLMHITDKGGLAHVKEEPEDVATFQRAWGFEDEVFGGEFHVDKHVGKAASSSDDQTLVFANWAPVKATCTALDFGRYFPPPWGAVAGVLHPIFKHSVRQPSSMSALSPSSFFMLGEPNHTKVEKHRSEDEFAKFRETDEQANQRMAMSFLMNVGVVAIFVFMYNSKVTQSRRPNPPVPELDQGFLLGAGGREHDFLHGPFGCFEDFSYCLHGCFCTIPRAADTAAAAGTYGFWFVVGVYYCLWCINLLTDFASKQVSMKQREQYEAALGLISLGFLILDLTFRNHLRTQLRQRYTKAADGLVSFDCVDFFKVACCFQCTTIQEARYVDHVASVRVDCCCSYLELPERAPLLGQPVQSRAPAPAHPPGMQAPPPVAAAQPAAPVAPAAADVPRMAADSGTAGASQY